MTGDLFAGRDLKEKGQKRVELNNDEWVREARDWARKYAAEYGTVTSDDLQQLFPPPATAHPNVMGSVFRHGGFRRVGYRQTARKDGHARVISIWAVT